MITREKRIIKTGDKGKLPEREAMYDSKMKVYLNNIWKARDKKQAAIIENNISFHL